MPALAAKEAAGKLPCGALAVLYDKNKMEASGYAAALADLTGEQVINWSWQIHCVFAQRAQA